MVDAAQEVKQYAGDNMAADNFTWFSNPLDWRPIDRFILLAWLVMIAPVLFGVALLATLLFAPDYINTRLGLGFLYFYIAHIVIMSGFLLYAFRLRLRSNDWPAFENTIIASFLINIFASSYVTGTHFSEGLLFFFLGVNITSALANIHKIRIAYIFVCCLIVFFAIGDFSSWLPYAPLFAKLPLGNSGGPPSGWLAMQVVMAAVLLTIMSVCIAAVNRWVERESLYREMSTIDSLTRLTNRRTLIERGEKQLARARRSTSEGTGASFACIMVDLDHFKHVNDAWGHHVGDQVLIVASQIMISSARHYDEVGRYGGEEFAIFLPNISKEGALVVAERIREKIAEAVIEVDGQRVQIAASLGVAYYDGEGVESLNDLLKAADVALYQAKEQGRNRVVVAR